MFTIVGNGWGLACRHERVEALAFIAEDVGMSCAIPLLGQSFHESLTGPVVHAVLSTFDQVNTALLLDRIERLST